MSEKDFHYEMDKDFNYTIDERGNTFIALRKIRWGDSDKFKLDLRKYISTEEGERMNKGVSFLTDDGPNELAKVLLENNYGKANEIADVICNKRKDIFDKLSRKVNNNYPSNNEDEDIDEELYDTRRLFDE